MGGGGIFGSIVNMYAGQILYNQAPIGAAYHNWSCVYAYLQNCYIYNPCGEQLFLESCPAGSQLHFYDVSGRLVQIERSSSGPQMVLQLRDLASGTYVLRASSV